MHNSCAYFATLPKAHDPKAYSSLDKCVATSSAKHKTTHPKPAQNTIHLNQN
jgi:hypothetical protein